MSSVTWALSCQFHQHFTYEFFVRTSFFYVQLEKAAEMRHLYEKFVRLTLMKLTKGVFLKHTVEHEHELPRVRKPKADDHVEERGRRSLHRQRWKKS